MIIIFDLLINCIFNSFLNSLSFSHHNYYFYQIISIVVVGCNIIFIILFEKL